MPRLISIFLCCFWAVTVIGQVELNKIVIPEPGDTLFFFRDHLPKNISVNQKGENLYWNYLALQAPFIDFAYVDIASSGSLYDFFSSADLVITSGPCETYYQLLGSELVELGGYGIQNNRIVWPFTWRSDNPPIHRKSVLKFQDSIQHVYEKTLVGDVKAINKNLVPDGFQPFDSIKIVLNISQKLTADAWGKVLFPGGDQDVLRIRTEETIEQQSYGYRRGRWDEKPIPDDHVLNWPAERTSYEYVNDGDFLPQTSISTESGVVQDVQYIATPLTLRRYKTFKGDTKFVVAKPNPAISRVRFSVFDLEPGEYQIEIYNILGQKIKEVDIETVGFETVEVNLSNFDKGTYLYSLVDRNGTKLITKRLIVHHL